MALIVDLIIHVISTYFERFIIMQFNAVYNLFFKDNVLFIYRISIKSRKLYCIKCYFTILPDLQPTARTYSKKVNTGKQDFRLLVGISWALP